MVLLVVVIPPPQLNVALLVVEDATSVWLVTEHVKTDGTAILALGGVVVCVTETEVLAVQPLIGSVTVTVYVAGNETV